MGAKLSFKYDRDADILHIDKCSPYPDGANPLSMFGERIRMTLRYMRFALPAELVAYNAATAKGRKLKKLAVIKIVKNRSALSEIDKGKPQKGSYEAFKYAPL
jgi:hypothetical protein